MTGMRIFWIMALLALVPLASAESCGAEAYANSCKGCHFQDGRMDPACYEGYQTSGEACLFAAYPLSVTAYENKKCPAIQYCIDQLNSCKASASTGNDENDCQGTAVAACFIAGDACIDDATKHCDTPANETNETTENAPENGEPLPVTIPRSNNSICPFFSSFIVLLLGAALFGRRQ